MDPHHRHPIFFVLFLHSAAVNVMRSLGVFVCHVSFAEWLDGENSGIRQQLCGTNTYYYRHRRWLQFLQPLFCQRVDLEESFTFQEG